jgi:hypothetical protein
MIRARATTPPRIFSISEPPQNIYKTNGKGKDDDDDGQKNEI